MGVNKVMSGSDVIIDLTSDTVTAEAMKSGITATAANGEKIIGTMVVRTIHTGSTTPASSLGNNGDIYLKV